jgi:hypothetical protein
VYDIETKMTPGRRSFASAALLIAMLAVVVPFLRWAQPRRCSALDLAAELQDTNRAYGAAMELAEQLEADGFTLKCVFRSTLETLFEGAQGAGVYRTDRGDFEALFLPTTESVERLTIVQNHASARYVYVFRVPFSSKSLARIDSPRPVYFIKGVNGILISQNGQLAAELRAAAGK